MGATKKYKITIEQVKKDIHSMELEATTSMEALDAARDMVKNRNQKDTLTGNVYSVKKVEEIKNG